jgi:prevent-host-death family protein
MKAHWQIQEAKQRFSDLVRRAQSDGAQFVTRHGTEVAVVIDIAEYRRLSGQAVDFKSYLTQGVDDDEFTVPRSTDLPSAVDLSDHQ